MPTELIKGDLFQAHDLDVYAHGCNCAGAMGKRIALIFRNKFPEMYTAYKNLCQASNFSLGDVFFWQAPAQAVFNLRTQKSWRAKASLPAIQSSVEKMIQMAEEKI